MLDYFNEVYKGYSQPYFKAMRKIILFLIILYQKTLSPDHGVLKYKFPYGCCSFYPSCSEYARLALEKYNVFTALLLIIRRILRCTPFIKPRVDFP